ncbi:hypothetical protein MD484_g7295, partial [Candolleomyces efflorescens]
MNCVSHSENPPNVTVDGRGGAENHQVDKYRHLYTFETPTEESSTPSGAASPSSLSDEEQNFASVMSFFVDQVRTRGCEASFLGHCYGYLFAKWPSADTPEPSAFRPNERREVRVTDVD